MENEDECPICFEKYGEKLDGSFLCRDGKINSDEAENCKHYLCKNCCFQLYKNLRKDFKKGIRNKTGIINVNAYCPLCRENWTLWLLRHYDSDSESESDESDESDD